MITPTAEQVEARRKGISRRVPWTVLAVLLMLASVVTPHIGVRAATETGRTLLPVSKFFLTAQAGAPGFAPVTNIDSLAAGLNIAYYGLSFQHAGLLLGLAFCWVLAVPEVGRWVRRFELLAGWFLVLSAVTVIIAVQLMQAGGVACYLGTAWAFCLGAGLIMVVGARMAKARLDSTWFWTKPDWDS